MINNLNYRYRSLPPDHQPPLTCDHTNDHRDNLSKIIVEDKSDKNRRKSFAGEFLEADGPTQEPRPPASIPHFTILPTQPIANGRPNFKNSSSLHSHSSFEFEGGLGHSNINGGIELGHGHVHG